MTLSDQSRIEGKDKHDNKPPYLSSPLKLQLRAANWMQDCRIRFIVIDACHKQFGGIFQHRYHVSIDTLQVKILLLQTLWGQNKYFYRRGKNSAQNRIEKLPVIDKSNNVVGLITSKDIMKMERYPLASKDKKGRLLVGGAVGVKGDYLDRTEELLNAGTDIIVVDIAHGHSDNAINAVHMIKKAFPDCELIAGNVATGEGVKDLIKAGVDAVKIGVGSGSICITRL